MINMHSSAAKYFKYFKTLKTSCYLIFETNSIQSFTYTIIKKTNIVLLYYHLLGQINRIHYRVAVLTIDTWLITEKKHQEIEKIDKINFKVQILVFYNNSINLFYHFKTKILVLKSKLYKNNQFKV